MTSITSGAPPPYIDPMSDAGRAAQYEETQLRRAAVDRYEASVRTMGTGIPDIPAGSNNVPGGIHAADWQTFAARFGGTPRREELLQQLGLAFDTLHAHGIEHALVGGSMMSTKAVPGDVDLAWAPESMAQLCMDGEPITDAIKAVAPDVNAHSASVLVTDAEQWGHSTGTNFLELFSTDKTGAPRGLAYLSTNPADRLLAAVPAGVRSAALGALTALH